MTFGARGKAKRSGHAPVDIHVFELALRLKVPPCVVRAYDAEVLHVAALLDKNPADVATWDARDRRWLLVTFAAQQMAAPELARRAAAEAERANRRAQLPRG
ncbi:MAG: hypothetical protein ACRD9R_16410 [Pyrinomonadaceae bacterium]